MRQMDLQFQSNAQIFGSGAWTRVDASLQQHEVILNRHLEPKVNIFRVKKVNLDIL